MMEAICRGRGRFARLCRVRKYRYPAAGMIQRSAANLASARRTVVRENAVLAHEGRLAGQSFARADLALGECLRKDGIDLKITRHAYTGVCCSRHNDETPHPWSSLQRCVPCGSSL